MRQRRRVYMHILMYIEPIQAVHVESLGGATTLAAPTDLPLLPPALDTVRSLSVSRLMVGRGDGSFLGVGSKWVVVVNRFNSQIMTRCMSKNMQKYAKCAELYTSANQSINQQIGRSTNQSIDQPINRSINQSINQSNQ